MGLFFKSFIQSQKHIIETFSLSGLNRIRVCKNDFFLKRESHSYVEEGTLGIWVPHYVYFIGALYGGSVVAANSQAYKVILLVCVPWRPMDLISLGFEILYIRF